MHKIINELMNWLKDERVKGWIDNYECARMKEWIKDECVQGWMDI